jgi:UDP-N-acetyl-D-mannosaminuronic acid dehydrogenase
LNGFAHEVLTTDPFVTADPDLLPLDEVIARSDVLILCTPHASYKSADLKGKPVVDVWGMLENANLIS